jgi:hypothetical protein
MATTTISIEEFQRDADRVGEASSEGPVFITRPGRSTLVVLDIEEYRKLSGDQEIIVEPSAYPDGPEIKFDRSRMTIEEYRKLTGHLPNIVDMLAGPEGLGDIDFEPPRMADIINSNRQVDLSD